MFQNYKFCDFCFQTIRIYQYILQNNYPSNNKHKNKEQHSLDKQVQIMQPTTIIPVYQNDTPMEQIAKKNNTTVATCGYITCAVVEYLAQQQEITHQTLKGLNIGILEPYIVKVMQSITKTRRLQVKKFMNKMNDSQKKNYLRDWVANYEMGDYLESIQDKIVNPNVYFFRQVSYDHPEALENLKYEQSERVKEQEQFQGGKYFYTAFNPQKNHHKEEFIEQVKKNHEKQRPIIIATDVLGHFNTTVILKGKVYVLDSLPEAQGPYAQAILEAIMYYYQLSYVKQ